MAINITRWSIALLVLLSVLPSVFGLYFYLEGSEQKCFTEELPKETVVTGHYTAEKWDEDRKTFVVDNEHGIEVLVDTLPDGNRVYSQKLPPKGIFKFTATESGEHAICIYTVSTGWFDSIKTRVTLDMSIRDMLEDDDNTEDSKNDMVRRLRELNSLVGDIRRDQSFLRDHESEFRDKSEATNSHAVTWTLFQIAVLAVTCAWQMRHLRVFFETRKMI
ncbi:emp24p/erv25p- protein [Podila epigama]|nr:emp24p/erv25p- protein [Podila epigama]